MQERHLLGMANLTDVTRVSVKLLLTRSIVSRSSLVGLAGLKKWLIRATYREGRFHSGAP